VISPPPDPEDLGANEAALLDSSAGSSAPVVSVDGVLGALGDATRRSVVELLAAGGGLTATSLAGELPVTRQAVVQHLAVLREAGLVESRRVGRDVRFELRSQALTETAAWIADVAAQWDRRLAVIAEIAETAQVEAALAAPPETRVDS
jgi:DNA-binding transcriptional ArsR family regulator